MDLASVVAALASVGVRVSGSTPNNNIQGDSSRVCPTGLAGPEPSGTHNDPGQHFHNHTARALASWLCALWGRHEDARGGASCLGVGRPGSGALPPPTARPLGGLLGPTTHWLWVRGDAGVGTRHQPHGARSFELALHAVGAARGRAGGGASCLGVGRPGSGALPPPTAHPRGGLPEPTTHWLWERGGAGVGTRHQPTARALAGWLCALWGRHEGARGGRHLPGCGVSRVGRSSTPDCPPSGRAAGLLCVCVPCLAGSGGPASRACFGAPHLSFGLSCFALCLFGSLRAGVALFVVVVGFCFFFCFAFPFLPLAAPPLCPALRVFWPRVPWALVSCRPPPSHPPSVRPVVSRFACFPAWGALGLGDLLPPRLLFFCFFCPPPSPFSLVFLASRLPLASAPPPFFFSVLLLFFPAARLLCVFWGVVLCVPCPARSLCCARRLCCFWGLVLLVAGVAAFCWGSAGGSGCPALSFGGVCQLWCPCLVWPSLGVLPVVSRSPVLCPVALCCRVVLCRGALSSFFLFLFLLVALVSCCSPLVLGSGPVPGHFCFCALPVRCCAGVPAPLLSVRCSLALAGLAGVFCCCLLCLCVCCWAWLSSVVSWWVLVAPGVVSRWRAVVCPWVLCCAVLLRVVPGGVALLCAVLFRFAPFGAAARCVVSWGAVLRLGVLCLLAPCFVLSPRAVCVLLWCVAAWCCSPLCFVPCAPWGVVLCVSCRLRPVRCCCVARSPSVPCFPVLCPVVLCCRVVPWCPVLLPCWVCFLRGCGCTYLKNRCKIS